MMISAGSQSGLICGDASIGADARVLFGAVITAEDGHVRIGRDGRLPGARARHTQSRSARTSLEMLHPFPGVSVNGYQAALRATLRRAALDCAEGGCVIYRLASRGDRACQVAAISAMAASSRATAATAAGSENARLSSPAVMTAAPTTR